MQRMVQDADAFLMSIIRNMDYNTMENKSSNNTNIAKRLLPFAFIIFNLSGNRFANCLLPH